MGHRKFAKGNKKKLVEYFSNPITNTVESPTLAFTILKKIWYALFGYIDAQ